MQEEEKGTDQIVFEKDCQELRNEIAAAISENRKADKLERNKSAG